MADTADIGAVPADGEEDIGAVEREEAVTGYPHSQVVIVG
jgi:hypothetical protein